MEMQILDVVTKLEEQAHSLAALSDEYLEQGLLGQHNEALAMREKVMENIDKYRPLLPPQVRGLSAVRAPGASAAPTSGVVASTAVPVVTTESYSNICTSGPEAPSALKEAVWRGPAGLATELLGPSASTADEGSSVPRYRWRDRMGGGAVLEVLEPSSGTDDVDVDVSETAVQFSWGSWALRLPFDFRADVEGFATVDGFLGCHKADALREHLLALWRAGRMRPGEVEGVQDMADPDRARSDEFLYAEDGDPLPADFSRRLDRIVVEVTRRVPALRDFKLIRGRPMAAVYAGSGSRYTPHFDCHDGDNGRLLTCILYLNPFWRPGDGAALRLWPEARTLQPFGPRIEVEPYHGRLVAFLCDGRNLHEVTPVDATGAVGGRLPEPRLALSCWYYDAAAIHRVAREQAAKDMP